jgi:hypothetical protein
MESIPEQQILGSDIFHLFGITLLVVLSFSKWFEHSQIKAGSFLALLFGLFPQYC